MKKLIRNLSLAFALVGFLAVIQFQAAQPQSSSDTDQSKMTERCKQMVSMRQRMMTDMKAQDEELKKLVSQMNSASADQKVDAMAAVINEIVTQRFAMRDRMMAMQRRMMRHMMQHMQMGDESMTECPMMKESTGRGSGTEQ